MIWIFFAFLLTGAFCTDDIKNIRLTTKNNLILKGPVNEKSVSRIIYDLNMLDNKTDIYLYLDTPGGEVESGQRLVTEIINHNVSCIAERAYSMGFAILQACNRRYILRHGKLMIHQISFGIKNELGKIESYLNFIQQIDFDMNHMMASRIMMRPDLFRERAKDEWWLNGFFAIKANCADEIATISCSKELTRNNYTESYGSYDYIYSKCPLVLSEIDKQKSKNTGDNGIFKFLQNNHGYYSRPLYENTNTVDVWL